MRRAAQAMLERGGDEALEPVDIDQALADMLGAAVALRRACWGRRRPSGSLM
jgi:hypothetical protein